MVYLSGRGFIHRDLAARNILLDEHMQCKVGENGHGLSAIMGNVWCFTILVLKVYRPVLYRCGTTFHAKLELPHNSKSCSLVEGYCDYDSVLQVTVVIKYVMAIVYSKQSKDIIAKLSNLYQVLLT